MTELAAPKKRPEALLGEWLLDCYSPDELRILLGERDDTRSVLADVAFEGRVPRTLMFDVVEQLRKFDLLDVELLALLAAQRPFKVDSLLAAAWDLPDMQATDRPLALIRAAKTQAVRIGAIPRFSERLRRIRDWLLGLLDQQKQDNLVEERERARISILFNRVVNELDDLERTSKDAQPIATEALPAPSLAPPPSPVRAPDLAKALHATSSPRSPAAHGSPEPDSADGEAIEQSEIRSQLKQEATVVHETWRKEHLQSQSPRRPSEFEVITAIRSRYASQRKHSYGADTKRIIMSMSVKIGHHELFNLEDTGEELKGDLSLKDIFLASHRCLLITGEAGAGKTTKMLELAEVMAREAQSDQGAPLPVYLSLAGWKPSERDFKAWTLEEFYSEYKISQTEISDWLESHRAVLLLDGLDEIRDLENSGRAHSELARISHQG